MDLMKLATQLLMNKMGGGNSGISDVVMSAALSKLLPTNNGGDLDLGGLVSQLNGGGLASLAASWLGDGSNSPVSGNQIADILGQSNVRNFANEIGVDENTASSGLSDIIPGLIDQNSKGGSLLDNDMVSSLAKSALGSLFK
jgi:uncharacterized protein YidB (DUF937 family)